MRFETKEKTLLLIIIIELIVLVVINRWVGSIGISNPYLILATMLIGFILVDIAIYNITHTRKRNYDR